MAMVPGGVRPGGFTRGSSRASSSGTSPTASGAPGQLPMISICIVAYNRREALGESLRVLRERLKYRVDLLEIIVVDNGSTDGTAQMVRERFPEVRLLARNENIGAPAWNEAFAVAEGEWCLILDDDCWVEGDSLLRATREAARVGADLVSFRVRSSTVPDFYFSDHYKTGLFAFWGCSALISRRALERLTGYDENLFLWGNELELTIRLLGEGFAHLYLADVTSVHMKGPPQPHRELALRNYGRHKRRHAYIAGKLLRPVDAALVLINLITMLLLDALTFEPKSIEIIPGLLRDFRRGMAVRRPVRAEVSRTYRRFCLDFVSPLRFLRGPFERLGLRPDSGTGDDRRERFRSGLPQFYPSDTGLLHL
jgi:GT2 family glycosyltransferase